MRMMGVVAGAFSVPTYYHCLLRIVAAVVAAGPGAGAGRRLRR